MFLFGHLGIGSQLVQPWSKKLPKKWILIGTLLPDIIDKSLYYGLVYLTGKHGSELGIISGTRTFGHTLFFLIFLTSFSVIRKSKISIALTLGSVTHLILDCILDEILHFNHLTVPLLWPFAGWEFPTNHRTGVSSHLPSGSRTQILAEELIGISLLFWNYKKTFSNKRRHLGQTRSK